MGCAQSTASVRRPSRPENLHNDFKFASRQLKDSASNEYSSLHCDNSHGHCVVKASSYSSFKAVAASFAAEAVSVKAEDSAAELGVVSDVSSKQVDQIQQQHCPAGHEQGYKSACVSHTRTEQHAGVEVKISRCPFMHGSVGVGPFPGYVHGNNPAICRNGCK
jgi:hypothetical protein